MNADPQLCPPPPHTPLSAISPLPPLIQGSSVTSRIANTLYEDRGSHNSYQSPAAALGRATVHSHREITVYSAEREWDFLKYLKHVQVTLQVHNVS